MTNHTRSADRFAGLMTAAAVGSTLYAGMMSHRLHPVDGLALLALAAATSRMKVRLPGLNGTMSVNLPFLLTAAVQLSCVETAVIALVCGLVQSWPKAADSWKPQQAWFNVSMMVLAANLTSILFHAGSVFPTITGPLGLGAAAASLFLGQTVPVSAIIALSEGSVLRRVWVSVAHVSFPYYVASVGVASVIEQVHRNMGRLMTLMGFAAMYAVHRSYRTYFQATAPEQMTPLARSASSSA